MSDRHTRGGYPSSDRTPSQLQPPPMRGAKNPPTPNPITPGPAQEQLDALARGDWEAAEAAGKRIVAADPITPERVTPTEADEHQAALHRIWREAAESNLREGVDWPRVARDLFKTLDELSDRIRAAGEREARLRALADEWDGYGHGKFNIHLEDALPCSVCDLLAQLRALFDGDEETTT